jgi:hypothetical protein
VSKKKHNKKSKTGGTNVVHKAAAPSGIKHDLGTAILTILGLVAVYVTMVIYSEEATPLKKYLSSQASASGFYANILALLSTAYGKATANFQVNGRTYLFSMFGYVLAAHIFAQAVFMNYPEIKLLFFADFMRSEWFAIIGHLALFGIIFALACSKGVPEYTKEIIKR